MSYLGSHTSISADAPPNPGCGTDDFQLPLFSLDDAFNLTQPPLDLDNFYHQPKLSPSTTHPAVVPNYYPSSSSLSPSSSSSSSSGAPGTLVPTVSVSNSASAGSSGSTMNQPPPAASAASATRKKRKKEGSPLPDEPNAGFDWSNYQSPAVSHPIYSNGQAITDQFEILPQKIEANTHFSTADNAWICYRQNQFKVLCSLKSPAYADGSLYVQDSGVPAPISQFCAKLYAIKEITSAVGEEMRVGLHHVGKSRVKKEKLDIGIAPFVNGRVEFSNVQFERSNAVKGQQLEYFHLVIAFYAKGFANNYYHIFSRMSMRLIVRSQNPGFYGDCPTNTTEAPEESGRSAGNSPNRDSEAISPNTSHESLSPLPTYSVATPGPQPVHTPSITPPTPMQAANTTPFTPTFVSHNLSSPSSLSEFNILSNTHPLNNPNAPPTTVPKFNPNFIQTHTPSNPNNNFMNTSSTGLPSSFNNGPVIRQTDIFSINNNNNSFNVLPPITTMGRDNNTAPASIGGGGRGGPGEGQVWKQEGDSPSGSSRNPHPGGNGGGGSGGDGNRQGSSGEPAWQQYNDVVVHHGKVGINTYNPVEALTVNGNILVTGNMYKPSDKRIKSDITAVDSSSQLSNLRNLKIYDYVVRSQQERGVLAQELQAIMPSAVHTVGNVENGSQTIPNFLVINERVLLFENIGATQQLDKELETEKKTIVEIDSRVAELKENTAKGSSEVNDKIHNLFDVLFAEENGDRMMLAGLEEEYLNIGFSIFKMGPPRSFFIIGFLFPWTWSLGALYVFSNIKARRIMGFSNLFLLLSFLVMYFCTQFYMMDDDSLTKVEVVWVILGIILLLINYVRMRRKLSKKMKEMGGKEKKKEVIAEKVEDAKKKREEIILREIVEVVENVSADLKTAPSDEATDLTDDASEPTELKPKQKRSKKDKKREKKEKKREKAVAKSSTSAYPHQKLQQVEVA